jgi:diguanylate cyclase (GGDEF)-like protein
VNFTLPHRLSLPAITGPARIPLIVATSISLFVIAVAFGLDRRHTALDQAALRAEVENAAGTVARRLSLRLQSDISTAEFIAFNLRREAADAARMNEIAQGLLAKSPHLAVIAVAPDFRLNHLFRSGAMETAPEDAAPDIDRLAADLATASNRREPSIIAGSQEKYLTLITPLKAESGNDAAPWGAVAILIDEAALTVASGMAFDERSLQPGLADLSRMNIAIRDADRPETMAFIGDDRVDDYEPIRTSLEVAGSTWTIQLAPRGGWDVTPKDQGSIRLLLLIATLGIVMPIFAAAYLISERNRNIAALRARESNLLDLSQRFSLAMDAASIGIWEMTGTSLSFYWDSRARNLHGRPAAMSASRLEDLLDTVMPEDRAATETHFLTCALTDEPSSETYRVTMPDGSIRHLRSAGACYKDGEGNSRMTGIVWDVSADMLVAQTLRDARDNSDIKNAELELALDELSNRERELEKLSRRLDMALESYGCGIWEFDPVQNVETWDARMCQLYGLPLTESTMTQERWMSLIVPEDRILAKEACSRFIEGDTQDALVVRVRQPDDSIRYIRSVGQLQTGKDGSRKIVGLAFDVTKDARLTVELQKAKTEADAKNSELELAKSRIEHNALHDPLTLLANRRKLDLELDRLSREPGRQRFAILHLDLDRFKQINDTLGHAAGDAMLIHAADILRRNVQSEDLVARIGGDEFVILIRDHSGSEEIGGLAERIVAEFRHPVDFEGFSCRCGVSIGIAEANGTHVDARRVLVNADLALYRAKGMGRNRYEFFTQNLHAEIIDHKRTADEVLAAIDNHEFTAWYQPQFCAKTQEMTGVEALIRWNHPHRGVLTPDRFLKIAEDLNVSATLDQIVLETALKDKMRWAAMGISVPRVSVNVSARRLHDERLVETLRGLSIAPGEIAFELVESIFLDDSDSAVVANLEKIKALGIDIEIDDFGTGHTSIVSLLKLTPKRLKIDRQLVQPILGSSQERALVRSIIDIARSLGVETVAEGVESFDHAILLRQLGCDLLQGYAFAKPLPFGEFNAAVGRNFGIAA